VKMDTFKGDVLCVVNVASKWGLTKQNYGECNILYQCVRISSTIAKNFTHWPRIYIHIFIVQFSKLYDEYNSRGFKILAFPCNQFGGQEPVRSHYV